MQTAEARDIQTQAQAEDKPGSGGSAGSGEDGFVTDCRLTMSHLEKTRNQTLHPTAPVQLQMDQKAKLKKKKKQY